MTYKDLLKQWEDNWFSFIKNNPNKKWQWKYIASNSNVRLDMIENSP